MSSIQSEDQLFEFARLEAAKFLGAVSVKTPESDVQLRAPNKTDLARIKEDFKTLKNLAEIVLEIIPDYVLSNPEYQIPSVELLQRSPYELYNALNRLFEEVPPSKIKEIYIPNKDKIDNWRYCFYLSLGSCSESLSNEAGVLYPKSFISLEKESAISRDVLVYLKKDLEIIKDLFKNLPDSPRGLHSINDIDHFLDNKIDSRTDFKIDESGLILSDEKNFNPKWHLKYLALIFLILKDSIKSISQKFRKQNKSKEEKLEDNLKSKGRDILLDTIGNSLILTSAAFLAIVYKVPIIPTICFAAILFYIRRGSYKLFQLRRNSKVDLTEINLNDRKIHINRKPSPEPPKFTGKIKSQNSEIYRQMFVTDPMVVISDSGDLRPLENFINNISDENEKRLLKSGLYRKRKLNLNIFDEDEDKSLDQEEAQIVLEFKGKENIKLPLPANYSIKSVQLKFKLGDVLAPAPVLYAHVEECALGSANIRLEPNIDFATFEITYTIKPDEFLIDDEVAKALDKHLPKPKPLVDAESLCISKALEMVDLNDSDKAHTLFRNFSRNLRYSRSPAAGRILTKSGSNLYEAVRGLRTGTCDVFAFGLNQIQRSNDINCIILHGYSPDPEQKSLITSEGHAQNGVIVDGKVKVYDPTALSTIHNSPFKNLKFRELLMLNLQASDANPRRVYRLTARFRGEIHDESALNKFRQTQINSSKDAERIDDVLRFEKALITLKETHDLREIRAFLSTPNSLNEKLENSNLDPIFSEYNWCVRLCEVANEACLQTKNPYVFVYDCISLSAAYSNLQRHHIHYNHNAPIITIESFRALNKLISNLDLRACNQEMTYELTRILLTVGGRLVIHKPSLIELDDAEQIISYLKFAKRESDSSDDYFNVCLILAQKFPSLNFEIQELILHAKRSNNILNMFPRSVSFDKIINLEDIKPSLKQVIFDHFLKLNEDTILAEAFYHSLAIRNLREIVTHDSSTHLFLERKQELVTSLRTFRNNLSSNSLWEETPNLFVDSPELRYFILSRSLRNPKIVEYCNLIHLLKTSGVISDKDLAWLLDTSDELSGKYLDEIKFEVSQDSDLINKENSIYSAKSFPITFHYFIHNLIRNRRGESSADLEHLRGVLAAEIIEIDKEALEFTPFDFKDIKDENFGAKLDRAIFNLCQANSTHRNAAEVYALIDRSFHEILDLKKTRVLRSIFRDTDSYLALIAILKLSSDEESSKKIHNEAIELLRDSGEIFTSLLIFLSTEEYGAGSKSFDSEVMGAYFNALPPHKKALLFWAFLSSSSENLIDELYHILVEPAVLNYSTPLSEKISKYTTQGKKFNFDEVLYESHFAEGWIQFLNSFELTVIEASLSLEDGESIPERHIKTNPAFNLTPRPERKSLKSSGDDFDYIKDYEAGDDFRRINHKVSARKGKFVVNTHREMVSQGTTLLIDLDWFLKPNTNDLYVYSRLQLFFDLVQKTARQTKDITLILVSRGALICIENLAQHYSSKAKKDEIESAIGSLVIRNHIAYRTEEFHGLTPHIPPFESKSILKLAQSYFNGRKLIVGFAESQIKQINSPLSWLKKTASEFRILK